MIPNPLHQPHGYRGVEGDEEAPSASRDSHVDDYSDGTAGNAISNVSTHSNYSTGSSVGLGNRRQSSVGLLDEASSAGGSAPIAAIRSSFFVFKLFRYGLILAIILLVFMVVLIGLSAASYRLMSSWNINGDNGVTISSGAGQSLQDSESSTEAAMNRLLSSLREIEGNSNVKGMHSQIFPLSNTASSSDDGKSWGVYYASDLKEYRGHIFVKIPNEVVGIDKRILMIEQLTAGVGLRDLFWDPATVIGQDLVTWRLVNDRSSLQLLKRQSNFRGNTATIEKSFPPAVLWSFPVLSTDRKSEYLIDLTDFLLAPVGAVHGNDLPSRIASAYGPNFVYRIDKERSAIDLFACHSNDYRLAFSRNLTYSFRPGYGYDNNESPAVLGDVEASSLFIFREGVQSVSGSSSAAFTPPPYLNKALDGGAFLTISSQRTFLLLDTYTDVLDLAAPIDGTSVGTARSESYRRRTYHPMSGFNSIRFMNEQNSLLHQRQELYIVRHNLQMRYSSAAASSRSEIVYYIDRNTPEPIRSALVEGVAWWDDAFQAAGYPLHTFRAEVMPSNIIFNDPRAHFDFRSPRFNFVEWIDRDLRTYSVGLRIADPISGEILKGHARIGSLRMRQDALIAEALLLPFQSTSASGDSIPSSEFKEDLWFKVRARKVSAAKKAVEVEDNAEDDEVTNAFEEQIIGAILQRVRQLGAHEVGHTLGLAHNFAGSSSGNGFESVMDYPPPLVTLSADGSELVLNNASYGFGIGDFDKIAIRYGYSQIRSESGELLSESQEKEKLFQLLSEEMKQDGYIFLTDENADSADADWRATRWDFGSSAIQSLYHALTVRNLALSRLNENAIRKYTPFSKMQELLPLVYFWHRYEVEAVCKLLGGQQYQYALKGAGDEHYGIVQAIPGVIQRQALATLIETFSPTQLSIPTALINKLLPNAFGYTADIGGEADLIDSRTGRGSFDRRSAFEILTNYLLSILFRSPRIERLALQAHLNHTLPGLGQVMELMTDSVYSTEAVLLHSADRLVELFTTQSVLLNMYLSVTVRNDISSFASGIVHHAVSQLGEKVTQLQSYTELSTFCAAGSKTRQLYADDAQCEFAAVEWIAHLQNLKRALTTGRPFMVIADIPDGSPI